MSNRSLSLILVRVLAIFIIATSIAEIPGIYILIKNFSYSASDEEPSQVLLLIISSIPIFAGIVIWFLSPFLANLICKKDITQETEQTINIKGIQSAVISVSGLLIIAVYLPDLIGMLINAYHFSGTSSQEKVFNDNVISYYIGVSIKIIFGIILLLGSNYFVKFINFVREFGLENKTSNKTN